MPTAPHARGAAEPTTLSPDRPGCEGRHPLLCRRLSSGCGGRRGSRDLARPTAGWGECWASPLGAQDEQPGWPRVCSDQRWPREDSQRGEGSRPRPGGGGRAQTRGWGGCRKPHGLGWRGPRRGHRAAGRRHLSPRGRSCARIHVPGDIHTLCHAPRSRAAGQRPARPVWTWPSQPWTTGRGRQ